MSHRHWMFYWNGLAVWNLVFCLFDIAHGSWVLAGVMGAALAMCVTMIEVHSHLRGSDE